MTHNTLMIIIGIALVVSSFALGFAVSNLICVLR